MENINRRFRNRGRNVNSNSPKESARIYESMDETRINNPHLIQNKEKILHFSETELQRELDINAKRKKYYMRKGEVLTVNHWGQRKLLLSEIEFLTEFGDFSDTVVYAGAAPGVKNSYLVSLFPEHSFVFVDPNPFDKRILDLAKNSDRVTVINDYFTDEMAKQYNPKIFGRRVLFISDIRTADIKSYDDEKTEDTIIKDNKMQAKWIKLMKPEVSMLKFRLPWGKGTTEYFEGFSYPSRIYLPVWGPQSTTETRLIIIGEGTHVYDNTEYEEQLFYFNTVTRVSYYEHNIPVEEVPGLCHCYDCSAEIVILKKWCRQFSHCWYQDENDFEKALIKQVIKMSLQMNNECSSSGRTLETNIDKSISTKWFHSDVKFTTPSKSSKETRKERSFTKMI